MLKSGFWKLVALCLLIAAAPSATPLIATQGGLIAGRSLARAAVTHADHQSSLTGAQERSLLSAYAKLPMAFESNQGQTAKQVKFVSRGPGYSLFLTPTEAVIALAHNSTRSTPSAKSSPIGAHGRNAAETGYSVLQTSLDGAAKSPAVTGLDPLPGKANYFIGNDPRKWHTNLPTYSRVKYHNVYKGIDLIYHGSSQRDLEYDFIVVPGGNPRSIEFQFRGADRLTLNRNGDLEISTAAGEVIEHAPLIYQEVDGRRRPIAGAYELKTGKRVGVRIGPYDTRKSLVIDPTLVYSTYLGGSDSDNGQGIAVDSAGDAYIAGSTSSLDFPVTPGAFQTISQPPEIFVTKLSPDGRALIYSTYAGNGGQEGNGIAVDAAGNAYVAGHITSGSFPTTASCPCGCGSLVFKLNPTGSALIYSLAFQGEGAFGIAVDTSDNAYLTGTTRYTSCQGTAGAYQPVFDPNVPPNTFVDGTDAWVAKFDSGGNQSYFTFLGSGGNSNTEGDVGRSIAVDASGSAYVAGDGSSDFPTTPGALRTAWNGQFYDGFVTKLDPTGAHLLYSTFLGGLNQGNEADSIAVDVGGNAYVAGFTFSSNFPTTPGAFQPHCSSNCGNGNDPDGFVSKLNSTGSGLVYSTYLGGSGFQHLMGIAIDLLGNVYVGGNTSSTDFPITSGAFQTTYAGGAYDAFVTELNSTGSALVYSTYLGGGGDDYGRGIAVDPPGKIYLAGQTSSTNFPVTSGSFQTTYGGGSSDAFVAKLDLTIWSMFHHDVQHTGLSAYSTSTNPGTQKWKFATGGGIGSSPAIGVGGTLYVGSSDKNLYAINPDGTEKWAFATGGNVGTSPAIGADGTIYFGSDDNNLYAVNPDGTQKWQFLSSGPFMSAAPTIGADGTIYVSHSGGDNNLYAINPDGTQKWLFAAAGTVYSSAAIGADGTVYITGGPNPGTTYLYALTDGGQGTVTQKWAFAVTDNCGNCQIGGSPAVGADGTIYFDSNNGFLYAVTANGTEKWKFATSNELHGSPAIGADGTVYFAGGGNDGIVYALTDNGTSYTEKWQFDTSGDIDGQAPAIGADGTVYVGSQDRPVDGSGVLFAITNSGAQKWAFFVANSGDGPSDSPAIGADGTIYFASFAGALYALGASSATPTATATATPTATATATDTATATATATDTATATNTATATATNTATATATPTDTATATATDTATATATSTATATDTATATPTATDTATATQTATATATDTATATATSTSTSTATATATSTATATATATATSTATATATRTATATPTATATATVSATPTATATPGALSIAPKNLKFGNQKVGTTSPAKTLTVTNSSGLAVTFTGIATAGDFAQTNTCDTNLGAHASCTINVTFKPTAIGTRNGTLTLHDNAVNNPQVVNLSGTGK